MSEQSFEQISEHVSEHVSDQAFEQMSEQPLFIEGFTLVECRVAIVVWCPVCDRLHGHVLTARDHPDLAGPRYWRVACQGVPYFLQLSSAQIATALERADNIGDEHMLSYHWRRDEAFDRCCIDADQPGEPGEPGEPTHDRAAARWADNAENADDRRER